MYSGIFLLTISQLIFQYPRRLFLLHSTYYAIYNIAKMSQNLELLMNENPSQWSAVSYVASNIQKKEIKPFVILALKELEGTPDNRLSTLVNSQSYAAVRSVVYHFTRLQSGDMWTSEDTKSFLEYLRFTPDCIVELTTMLCSQQLYNNVPTDLRVKTKLIGMKWKLDISLSQSNIEAENASPERRREIMHRDTVVILILTLMDGTSKLLRLSMSKYHELRYTVATILKNMIILERRKCMKRD